MRLAIIVDGGVGSPLDYGDGTEKAADVAFELLREGRNALDAVEAATVILEDDHRFNAGTGSYMRLDGSIEMDASIMDSEQNCGAVAAISRVKNPIKIARKVMGTPHVILAGEGAVSYARKLGFEEHDPTTEKAIKKLKEVKEWLKNKEMPIWYEKWGDFELCDTVGAVAMDGEGNFAAANSTGGTAMMMKGRVGDSAIIGAGLYVGEKCAVTTTGIGEEIIRKVLSKVVYDKIVGGLIPQEACEWGLNLIQKTVPMGIIAITPDGYGIASSKEMAYSIRSE